MKRILVAILTATLALTAMAENVNISIPMSLQPEWFEIEPIQPPDTNGVWDITFNLSVPRGHNYTNMSVQVSTDRMEMKIGPVPLSTAQMQAILGAAYPAVATSVTLGSFEPTGALKNGLVTAVAGGLE